MVADGGAAGVLTRNAAGEKVFESMELINVKRIQNKGGTWRWYATYRLPQRHGGGTVFLRLNAAPGDDKRKLKRAENLRLFPPSSPQYKALYGRRSDAESSNRHYKDSLWLDRAHCLGARRHLVTMYGYQQARNAIAIARHRARLLQSPLTA